MSLGRQAAQGAIWNYAAFLVSKGLLFVATLVLARILSPAQFGLVGMALLVILVLDILRDFGIGAALIYQQGDEQAAADLTFILSTGIGLLLFLANWTLAPLTAQFFKTNSPQDTATVVSLLQVLGLSLLFASIGSTQDSLLQKQIDFRRKMIPEVGRTLIKGLLQVALALMGYGVWSLVIGQVVGEACATILLWLVSSWRPTFKIERRLVRPMLGYSVHIMMVNGLGTFLTDVDYLIIGRLLGEAALGLYTLAFRIPELIIRNLAQAVSNVAFPVAARLQADLASLRDAYLRMQHYMMVILAPMGFGLYAITPILMRVLFKPQWEPAIPVMEVLTIYMVIGGIGHWPGVIYKAMGRPDILNRLGFVKLTILVPVLWWGAANYGIEGVAWGQLGARIVSMIIDMAVVSRIVHVSVLSNLRIISPPIGAAIIMAAAMRALFLLDPTQRSVPMLAACILAGGLIYAVVIWLLDREAVLRMLTLARSMLRRGATATEGEGVG